MKEEYIQFLMDINSTVDGGLKGGYLIRSITKAVVNNSIFLHNDFDGIMQNVRDIFDELVGTGEIKQVIEDQSMLNYQIQFRIKYHKK